ncbi:hypothetical protein AB0P07_31565 [Streptomyces sp. NPDC085944]|uniref:hypothetical protein n=1 Tax=Streptomyces sp. NPDC085944 TaxID=3154962 RepID=UPI003445F0C3
MRGKTSVPGPDRSTARSAVAVSVAALITAAAPEGPLVNNINIALRWARPAIRHTGRLAEPSSGRTHAKGCRP